MSNIASNNEFENNSPLSSQQALALYRSVRRRYRRQHNKQRVREQFCSRFQLAERSFYRKISNNTFTALELRYLMKLMDKKGGKR